MESFLNTFIVPEFLPIVLGTFVVLLFTFVFYSNKNPKWANLPPGPPKLPLLGNLLQMVKNPHLKLSKWSSYYGNMCTVYFGPNPALLVSDLKMLREIFGMYACTGKFKTDTLLLLSQGSYGILNTEGKDWQEQRQFYMRNLKQFGCGTNGNFEKAVLQEAEKYCQWILKASTDSKKSVVAVHQVLSPAITNTLWSVASGEELPLENSPIEIVLRDTMSAVQYSMQTGLGFFPWIKNIAPRLSGYNELDRACKAIHKIVEECFERHLETFVEGQNRDVIDAYIEQWKNMTKSGNSSFSGEEGWKNCISSIVEVFVAGGQNSTNTLHWIMVYLSRHLDVQRKLQEEIDEIIGDDREPSLNDRQRMPYAEAVILEAFRYSSEAPFGAFHELLEDITYQGYKLHKGLILIANMYHVHHNPEIWGDPENFRPERFLEGNNESINEELKRSVIPFQIGKRQCPGEPLAKDIIFLFMTKFFQRFNVELDPSIKPEEYMKPDVGIVLMARNYGLVVKPRLQFVWNQLGKVLKSK